jgi:hypothetical protein
MISRLLMLLRAGGYRAVHYERMGDDRPRPTTVPTAAGGYGYRYGFNYGGA